MTTLMLLLARHDGQEDISFREMAKEYFGLEPEALERKMKNGRIQFDLPTKGANAIRTSRIPLTHLAKYIQERRAAAIGRMIEYGQE
ncbi:pyocin activator PrtN family protein [Shimia sp. R9_3]|uniref:pyocin activator PrtN family protein n=1 Tax=Shimia sp. R9_3 TaxID=2821113 RepID=UPI001ADC3C2C|nr:pyocin activator PrtN family protein [Shimia sp. R9_3]MBO9400842.1 pyocin activator PrtN family protein [Shimia sp. R9_3]